MRRIQSRNGTKVALQPNFVSSIVPVHFRQISFQVVEVLIPARIFLMKNHELMMVGVH